MKVLVVEDNQISRKTVSKFVHKLGNEVDQCGSAVEAISLIEKGNYDIVLTDIKMPQMSGIDLLKYISTLPHKIDVVLFTGQADLESAITALRYGAVDYLLKPIDIAELFNVLKTITKQRDSIRKAKDYVNIVLYCGHSFLSEGLRHTFQTAKDINLVGDVNSYLGLSALLKTKYIDVILIDIETIDVNYLTAFRNVKREYPGINMVALVSSGVKTEYRDGICFINLKSYGQNELVEFLKEFEKHNPARQAQIPEIDPPAQFFSLTDKEREILFLVANGKTNKEIASELHISPNTVRNYISKILNKLDIPNRTAAAVYFRNYI